MTLVNMKIQRYNMLAFVVAFIICACLPMESHGYLAKCGGDMRIATGDTVQRIMEEMRACYDRGQGICIELRAEEVQKISDEIMKYSRGSNGLDVARFCQDNQCARATYTERGSTTPTYIYRVCSPWSRDAIYPELRQAVERSAIGEYAEVARLSDANSLLSQFQTGIKTWQSWAVLPRAGATSASTRGFINGAPRG